MISAILLLMALPAGCASDAPVSVDATAAPRTSPTAAPPAPSAETTPTATQAAVKAEPTAASGQPAAWRFPLDAASLFSPGSVPDDYMRPLYVSGDSRMFLYMTDEGNIRKSLWNGEGYNTLPVVENVDAGRADSVVVDEAGKRLFCAGVRQLSGGADGQAIVMIDLDNGERVNVDERACFSEEGRAVSSDFQYDGGMLLVRLADAKGAPLAQWALFDLAGKTYRLLDFTRFRETFLPGWRETVSLSVALAGDRLLAFCAVGGYAAPAATGTADAARQPYECLAIPLDLRGGPAGEAVPVAGGGEKTCCALQSGARFRASADGKRLLYAGADGGLYIYDIAENVESAVAAGGAALTFAIWGGDSAVYYATAAQQPSGGHLIYRADMPAAG